MMSRRLADVVISHSKLIVVLWVAVLLLSVYPALHASSQLSYDTSSMGGGDSESIRGSAIIAEHFESMGSNESMQIILLTYSAEDEPYVEAVSGKILQIPTSNDKIQRIDIGGQYAQEGGGGMVMFAVTYKDDVDGVAVDIQDDTGNLRSQVKEAVSTALGDNPGSMRTYVTGTPAISYDASQSMAKDLSIIDPFAILLILVLVGLFFRSFVSSAAPPATIGVAFALVMCVLFFLGQVFDIYYLTEVLLLVSMLGAGCDYCIFILARYREERRSGKEHIPACREAITWAGESVATSGIAVIIGFGAMMLCSFGLIKYIGLGLAIGIVFALFAALTLMSSLLVIFGDRLFWPTGQASPKLERGYMKRMNRAAMSYFRRSSRFSINHAGAIVAATLIFTVPMVYVYATSEDSYDMIGSMMSGESREGMDIMVDYAGGGVSMPNYAVIETAEPLATVYVPFITGELTWNEKQDDALDEIGQIMDTAAKDDNVAAVYVSLFDNLGLEEYGVRQVCPTWESVAHMLRDKLGFEEGTILEALEFLKEHAGDLGLSASTAAMIDQAMQVFAGSRDAYDLDSVCKTMDWLMYVKTGALGGDLQSRSMGANYIKMTMETQAQAMSDASIATLDDFKDSVHGAVSGSGYFSQAYICGSAAVILEISEDVGREFIKIEIVAMILIILLLFFVLKSYLTPLRSVLTIFMSVIWTVAITHLLFTNLLHAEVIWMLPILLLVICLGLGMDYDILLTTRIREYHMSKGMSNDEAIEQAVEHSGSVITICGIIMAGTFGTMMLSGTVMLQQMGFGLCFAILVDALIVRTYIVPAAMHLMGEWNWKGPSFLKRRRY